jgi:hypothetical protein
MFVHGLRELGVALVTPQQGRAKIWCQGQLATLALDDMPDQDDSLLGQTAQAQIIASIGPGQER